MFMHSCSRPWLSAPSPKKQTKTSSLPRARAARAAPAASGMPPPTMPFVPRLPCSRSNTCMEPLRPPHRPVSLPRISASRAVTSRALGEAMAVAAMMAGDHVACLERGDDADVRRFLSCAQVRKARHGARGGERPHRFLEMADEQHGAMHGRASRARACRAARVCALARGAFFMNSPLMRAGACERFLVRRAAAFGAPPDWLTRRWPDQYRSRSE